MAARKPRRVKLYTEDDCSEWIWAKRANAKEAVDLNLEMDRVFIRQSRRGVPWRCLLSRGVSVEASRNPKLFPHPVKFVYTIGTSIYVLPRISPKNPGELPLAIRYRHNFTKTLRRFDTLSKSRFFERFGDQPVEIRLAPPPRKKRVSGATPASRPQASRKPASRDRDPLVGAAKRARDAGLLNLKALAG